MMERFSSLVTKSRPWPVIGRTIFFTSDKNRVTNQKPAITHRDEIYFIDFWRENLSMYRIKSSPVGIEKARTWIKKIKRKETEFFRDKEAGVVKKHGTIS